MAVDKTDAGAVQAGGDAAKQKKTTKKAAGPKLNQNDKAVAEAKAAYKDLDLSEGRSLRKRAAAPSSGPKKSPAKKTKKPAAKKAPAPKKGAKEDGEAAAEEKPAAAKKGAKGKAAPKTDGEKSE
jgi:hypothetical protein